MFLFEDSGRESFFIVVKIYRNTPLNHDRTVVEFEIHQMDRTPRYLDAVLPCLPLPVQPRE